MTPSSVSRRAGISIALLLAWLALWLGTTGSGEPKLALFKLGLAWLPLAPALPLVWRGNRKAAGWISMAGVFYAGFAVMEAVANPAARWWAATTLALSLAMISLQVALIRSLRSQGS